MAVLVSESEILNYIPQREPIVMVSEILSCEAGSIRTRLNMKAEHLFVADGCLQEPGIIENIAQTAAAMTGYETIKNNLPVKKGFIGSVKRLCIHKLPLQAQPIETEVRVVTEVFNATVIEGSVYQNNELIASCEMNIFLEE